MFLNIEHLQKPLRINIKKLLQLRNYEEQLTFKTDIPTIR